MKRYLFTTLPSNDLGLLTRSLPIAQELKKLGHEIAFCSPAKAPERLVSEAGFDNLLPSQPIYYFISGDMTFKGFSRLFRSNHLWRDLGILYSFLKGMIQSSTAEIWDLDHFMYLFGMGNEDFVQANVEALIEVIDKFQPDVVVDFWNPFACIAARHTKTPLITVIQADMHPESQGFIWWKEKSSDLYPSPIPATNQILKQFALPKVQKMGELLVGDVTLVLGLPELDPLPASADVTYIGPILWQHQEQNLPDWIDNLNTDLPLIWLYPGNIQYMRGSKTAYDSMIVLETCVEALDDQAVNVVVTTGHHSLPKQFTSLPDNFFHEAYVPGLTMAERSDLLIHHGGYGSCQTGLFMGTPALIIPTYSERESNARRIAEQGAGDYLVPTTNSSGRKKELSADAVRKKVFELLEDQSYKANATKISEQMHSFGGAQKAASIINAEWN